MIVIKNFEIGSADICLENIKRYTKQINGVRREFGVLENKDLPGYIALPQVFPTAVQKYQGIDIRGAGSIQIAMYAPFESAYKVFDEGGWVQSPNREFMPLDTVNQGIKDWYGALKIELELLDNAFWYELDLGYEVGLDLGDWMLRFGIVDLLIGPIDFCHSTYTNDGRNVQPPPYTDLALMLAPKARDESGRPVEVRVNQSCDRLELTEPIAPGGIFLEYQFPIWAEYVYDSHQIDRLPVITVSSLGESERRDLMWNDPIGDHSNLLTYYYNLNVEITIVADLPEQVTAIARQLYARIKQCAKIYAPPFDLDCAIVAIGGLKQGNSQIEGSLPSASFKAKVVNLFAN